MEKPSLMSNNIVKLSSRKNLIFHFLNYVISKTTISGGLLNLGIQFDL